jgi:hypothetical protein
MIILKNEVENVIVKCKKNRTIEISFLETNEKYAFYQDEWYPKDITTKEIEERFHCQGFKTIMRTIK